MASCVRHRDAAVGVEHAFASLPCCACATKCLQRISVAQVTGTFFCVCPGGVIRDAWLTPQFGGFCYGVAIPYSMRGSLFLLSRVTVAKGKIDMKLIALTQGQKK